MTAHEWVSFEDDDGDTWMFDLTFLTSNWTCIFGRGCPGVLTAPAPELEHGCCDYGAHFVDDDDRERTEHLASLLTDEQWQLAPESRAAGGPVVKDPSGDWVTRQVDDACVFLNRAGFAGGAGCALHRAALELGDKPLQWKPTVCWQLPLRLDQHTDDNEHATFFVREWKRRDWGGGGAEFAWWCTEGHEAFVGGDPVYVALRDELLALVGEEPYDWLVDHVASRGTSHLLRHPGLAVRSANA